MFVRNARFTILVLGTLFAVISGCPGGIQIACEECPSGSVCGPSGACVAQSGEAVEIDVGAFEVSGHILINGEEPECDENEWLASLIFREAQDELIDNPRFYVSGHWLCDGLFKEYLPPGRYDVLIESDNSDGRADILPEHGRHVVIEDLEVSAPIEDLVVDVPVIDVSGFLTLNGAPPPPAPPSEYSSSAVFEFIALGDDRLPSFAEIYPSGPEKHSSHRTLTSAETPQGLAYATKLYPGEYRIELQGWGSSLPDRQNLLTRVFDEDESDLVLNVNGAAKVVVSGTLLVDGEAPNNCEVDTKIGWLRFRDANDPSLREEQIGIFCGGEFAGGVAPGDYDIRVQSAWVPPSTENPPLPRSGVVTIEKNRSISTALEDHTFNLPLIDIEGQVLFEGSQSPAELCEASAHFANLRFTEIDDPDNSTTVAIDCEDQSFGTVLLPGSYDVRLGGYPDTNRADIDRNFPGYLGQHHFSVNESNLEFEVTLANVSGTLLLNGSAWQDCEAESTLGNLHFFAHGQEPNLRAALAKKKIECGGEFSFALVPGAYDVAFVTFSSGVDEPQGRRPIVARNLNVDEAGLDELMLPLTTQVVSGSIFLNDELPVCGESLEFAAFLYAMPIDEPLVRYEGENPIFNAGFSRVDCESGSFEFRLFSGEYRLELFGKKVGLPGNYVEVGFPGSFMQHHTVVDRLRVP